MGTWVNIGLDQGEQGGHYSFKWGGLMKSIWNNNDQVEKNLPSWMQVSISTWGMPLHVKTNGGQFLENSKRYLITDQELGTMKMIKQWTQKTRIFHLPQFFN